jgi:hypothetical protein
MRKQKIGLRCQILNSLRDLAGWGFIWMPVWIGIYGSFSICLVSLFSNNDLSFGDRNDRYISGELDYSLSIRNQQHRSKYGKGEL